MATLVTMSETDTFDLHAVRHHRLWKESSGMSEYHQREHLEGCSHGSRRLIAFLFFLPLNHAGVVIDMQA